MPLIQEPRTPSTSRSQPARSGSDLVWNVLTVLVWLGMASMVMAFVSIYINPEGRLNPLRPSATVLPTAVSAIELPTATFTVQVSPTLTVRVPKPTRTATPTSTPVPPTVTPTPTLTPTETLTPGPSPTNTIASAYPFILRGDPVVLASSTFPEHEACKLWVAGQTYDMQGAPMLGITVVLGGYLDGKNMYQLSLTGTALQLGQAGYEFGLAEKPAHSKQSLWVQLYDQAMIPLSGKAYFDTAEDCSKNMVIINFKQIR